MIMRYILCIVSILLVRFASFSQTKDSVEKCVQEVCEENVFATAQGKYYMSFTDYIKDSYKEIQKLEVSARDNGAISGGNYKITTDDKRINKLLKNEIRIVEWNNLLFVNCKGLKNGMYRLGAGYAMGYRGKGKNILFVSMPVGKKESFLVSGAGVLLGAIGGMMVSSIAYDGLVCYRLSSDSNRVERLYAEDIELLLFNRPDLVKDYRKEKKRNSASVIMKYLRQSGYIQAEE